MLPLLFSFRRLMAMTGVHGTSGVALCGIAAILVFPVHAAPADRPPRTVLPAAVQLEWRAAEARFESALAQDCAPDKCFSNGCVYVSHVSTDLPRETALPGLDSEQGPGSVAAQDTLTEIRCSFSHERALNAKDVAALSRRLEQRLSRGWLRVSVTNNELPSVPRHLANALHKDEVPMSPPEPPQPEENKDDTGTQAGEKKTDSTTTTTPSVDPGPLTAQEALRGLWSTLLPHSSWMMAIFLLTTSTLALIWAGRRLGAPTLDERVVLAQLENAPPSPTPEPTPTPAPAAHEPSAEDVDFLKAQESLWSSRLSDSAMDSDRIMADLLQEWLRAGNFPMLARALLVFGDRVSSALVTDPDLAMKKLEFAAYFRDVDESTLPSRSEFFRRLNQHSMASSLLSQADVKPYRMLREEFGSSGIVDLMEQLPARSAALLFALLPRDSQSDVARLMPQPLRRTTAEHLLASTRMARAESEFIFQSIAAVREGRPVPPPPPVGVADRGPAIDGATALSVLLPHVDQAQRAQLFGQAVAKSGGNAPRWFEDILYGPMLEKLDSDVRQDLLLEVDIRGLAAWLGTQEQEWQRTFTSTLSSSLQGALRTNGTFASRDDALRHARIGHEELTRALKLLYAKERVTFLTLAA
jgi:hypothetical protein